MSAINTEASKAYDGLSLFHVAKLKSVLWLVNGVHFGSSIFSRINDLI